jgi:hypothetical protein
MILHNVWVRELSKHIYFLSIPKLIMLCQQNERYKYHISHKTATKPIKQDSRYLI